MRTGNFENNKTTRDFAKRSLMVTTENFDKAVFNKAWAKWVRFANNYNSPCDMDF